MTNLLKKVLYAGYIDLPKWNVKRHPAKHEPLISFEIFQTIQQKLKGQAKAPARKDSESDFPLRGFVTCGCCEQPMTACWSTGKYKKYPYYHCSTKGCDEYKKSIRNERIEEEFEDLLLQLRPSQNLFYMANAMFKELWADRQRLAG